MLLTDEEKAHLLAIEETRYELRRAIEARHSAPSSRVHAFAASLWRFLNSSLFITVIVGTGLSIFISHLDKENERRSVAAKEDSDKLTREIESKRREDNERLATRLKLLEEDRAFLTSMTDKVTMEGPSRTRIASALNKYRTDIHAAYQESFDKNFKVELPGLNAILELVAVETERSVQKTLLNQKAASDATNDLEKATVLAPLLDEQDAPISAIERIQLRPVVETVIANDTPSLTNEQQALLSEVIAKVAAPVSEETSSDTASVLEAAGRGAVRLFVHVADDKQRAAAEAWVARLKTLQWEGKNWDARFASASVLTYDEINVTARKEVTDVRYEGEQDKALALKVREFLKESLPRFKVNSVEKISKRHLSGYGRQIEIWLNKDATLAIPAK